jgi:ATP-dependent DNA ligase
MVLRGPRLCLFFPCINWQSAPAALPRSACYPYLYDMASRRTLPAGFVVPAQPIEQHQPPPMGAGWVHEIKQDGYRMLVRRDGGHVRLFSRKAIDWTNRLPAIAAGAGLLKAKSFTIG